MLGHSLAVKFNTLEVSLEADAQRSLSVASGPLRDSLPMSILNKHIGLPGGPVVKTLPFQGR